MRMLTHRRRVLVMYLLRAFITEFFNMSRLEDRDAVREFLKGVMCMNCGDGFPNGNSKDCKCGTPPA